ncbi:MAG TPA: YaeQ family protein [Polyangiaceae bacterium]
MGWSLVFVMALTATMHHVEVTLSDVDRSVYESLDLRLARHPSESPRYLLTRLFAYCLSYEEGIAFSKGGLSSNDEPPIAVRDPTGLLLAWIDVGSPSAERLHKASKAARRVLLYTHVEPALLRREASTRAIHKVEDIEVWRLEPAFLDALEPMLDRSTKLEVARNDGGLYVTVGGRVIEGSIARVSLL